MTSKPLRLFMTTDTVGNVWAYTMQLLRALQATQSASRHCEVMLVTMGAPLTQSQRQSAAQLPNLILCESLYKLEGMDDPWDHVDASSAWLMELARDFQPHLVHLNNFAHAALPWQAPVVIAAHSCVLSWWQAVKGTAAPAVGSIYQRRVRAGLAKADMVIAPTRAMLTDLESYYGPFRNSQVIYNAACPVDYVPKTDAPKIKEKFIFTTGRVWDEAKNIALLDQVAPKLPWPIYAAGEQWHPNGKRVELKNVRALGRLDPEDVRDWMARAAIYVHPARYEPFGLSIVEAALSGCTLVLSDILSLRELWDGAALFVPAGNPNMFVNCLRYLTVSPARSESLAQAARRRAEQYSPKAMGQAYWNVYNNLGAAAEGRYTNSEPRTQRAAFLSARPHIGIMTNLDI